MRKLSKRNHAAVTAFATAAALALATTAGFADDTTVVAKVDGAVITEADMKAARAEIGQQIAQMPPLAQRRVLIEFLIENQLVAGSNGGKSIADTDLYKSRLEYSKRRILRDIYFEKNVRDAVTEKGIKAFYEKEVAKIPATEEIQAAHILVKEEEKAKELYEKLVHDGDFAEIAKANSIDPGSKARGGDLGYFAKGQMVPAFEKAAFALKEGEISEPVKSRFGWHIIKLTDRRTKEPPKLEQLSDRIKQVLIRQKAKEVVEKLRADAKIEYVDPQVKKQIDSENARSKSQSSPKPAEKK
ncbi:MAG: peptidylprolyl isomerase [Pseudomonadota bacterium]